MLIEKGNVEVNVKEFKELLITRHFMDRLADKVEDEEDVNLKSFLSDLETSINNDNGELSDYDEEGDSYYVYDTFIADNGSGRYDLLTTNKPHYTFD